MVDEDLVERAIVRERNAIERAAIQDELARAARAQAAQAVSDALRRKHERSADLHERAAEFHRGAEALQAAHRAQHS